MITKDDLKKFLIDNSSFFNHVYVIENQFNVVPDKKHFGVAINYIDVQEKRTEFLQELINTIVDWVYSQNKYNELHRKLCEGGRTAANASSEIQRAAHAKFRKSKKEGKILSQGQFGELLLFAFLQEFFGAVPILRKMPLATSDDHERFGADAIHYAIEDGKNLIYLGEAKSYTSKYKFDTAFEDALKSIINTYETHLDELDLYIYEGFIEKELQTVADAYKNSTLTNCEVRLVSMVSYNETKKIAEISENHIKQQIEEIIKDRYKNFDDKTVSSILGKMLTRITYIVFPIWEFDKLMQEFEKKLGC